MSGRGYGRAVQGAGTRPASDETRDTVTARGFSAKNYGMAHAPTPQPRPSSSELPAAAARPDAVARPDDEARAWAFLARRTAWEHRLDALRRDAGTPSLEPVVEVPAEPVSHTEAA